jgi:hypothetical protein
MATRIRYIKEGDEYLSARFIPVKGGEARITLRPFKKEGFIHVGSSNIRVVGTSLHKIKIAVKKVLIELGAEFENEEREMPDVEETSTN